MLDKVLNAPLILQLVSASTHLSISDFFKNNQKHQSAKPFIPVFTPKFSYENVSNRNFFEPQYPMTTENKKIRRFLKGAGIQRRKLSK